MNDPDLRTMSDRLDRLERENRRLRRTRALPWVAVVVLALLGAGLSEVPKVIEAERFVLRDKQGAIRAALQVEQDGESNLTFFDRAGEDLMHLGVDSDSGAVLRMDGKVRGSMLELGVNRFGASTLEMMEIGGNLLMLSATGTADGPEHGLGLELGDVNGDGGSLTIELENGKPGIHFLPKPDPKNRMVGPATRFGLYSDLDGSAELEVSDKAGNSRLKLGGRADGTPYLEVRDAEGKVQFQAPTPK